MPALKVHRGQRVTLQATFTSDNDVLTAPTNKQLDIRDPAGTLTTVTSGFDNPSTGVYQYDVEAALDGVYHYRWSSSGNIITSAEDHFVCLKSSVLTYV